MYIVNGCVQNFAISTPSPVKMTSKIAKISKIAIGKFAKYTSVNNDKNIRREKQLKQ